MLERRDRRRPPAADAVHVRLEQHVTRAQMVRQAGEVDRACRHDLRRVQSRRHFLAAPSDAEKRDVSPPRRKVADRRLERRLCIRPTGAEVADQPARGTERATADLGDRSHRSIDGDGSGHRQHPQHGGVADHRQEPGLPSGNGHPHATRRTEHRPGHVALHERARGLDPRSAEVVHERLVHHHVDAIAFRGPPRHPSGEVDVHAAVAEAVRHPLHEQISRSGMPVERGIRSREIGQVCRKAPSVVCDAAHGVRRFVAGPCARRGPDVHLAPAAGSRRSEHPRVFAHAAQQRRELRRDDVADLHGCSRQLISTHDTRPGTAPRPSTS